MNLFGIGSNGANKVGAGSGNNKQKGVADEDFLSFLSKATESDKPVQEKPKAASAEKDTAKDKVEETGKEETAPKEKVENKQAEKEVTAPQDENADGDENIMAAYLNQMTVTPLLLNRNTTAVDENAEILLLQANQEQMEAAVIVEETANANLQQNNNQSNLQNQMLNFLKSNLTEEQQVQRMNMVDTMQMEEQEVVVRQENVQTVEVAGEENSPQQNQNVIMQTEAVEEVVLTQPMQAAQTPEGQIQIPVSDSSTLIQSQPAMQLADKILVNIQNGVQEFNMTLNPERLGQVTVKMLIENGIVNLHVQVHNAAAQTALAAGLGELRALLENNNLQVAEIEISMYSGEEQQEKEAAQQENRKGQARYQTEVVPEEELITEEEMVMVETSELNYSI